MFHNPKVPSIHLIKSLKSNMRILNLNSQLYIYIYIYICRERERERERERKRNICRWWWRGDGGLNHK